MSEREMQNVLFVCTGNSVRSLMAEAILNREGAGRYRAFSAGSQPRGSVHAYTLDVLKGNNYVVDDLRSKSWNEFTGADAPQMDFIFTLCDRAAAEACPTWPGAPISAHWGIPDPLEVDGNEAVRRAAFADAMRHLTNRISIFVNLQRRLDEIGSSSAASS